MRTMTVAQMNWNLWKGYAWYELDANGQPNDDWRMPIWTKDGGWVWNNGPEQCYELVII